MHLYASAASKGPIEAWWLAANMSKYVGRALRNWF